MIFVHQMNLNENENINEIYISPEKIDPNKKQTNKKEQKT